MMKILTHILSFEWKSLWRNSNLSLLLFVVAGAGMYGIYFGKFEIDKQENRIAQVQDYERQQFDSLLYWATLDTSIVTHKEKYQQALSPTGAGWNKHFTYYVAHDTPPLAGLCLGQRDLYPVYYGFNVTDLGRQVNIGELANPMKLLSGNFDLSYVIIFLFPLLIIAFFYDLYAKEREGGTLILLESQTAHISTVLLGKGVLRLLIILGLATGLILLGFFMQGISLSNHAGLFLQWLGLTYGYCLFWTAIMAGIIALRKNSSISAMYGLGVWLLLTIITPALLNLMVLSKAPLPNRAESIHVIRTLNDKNWESPKSFVFDRFYPQHPQYDQGDTTNFDKWYYASFILLDEKTDSLNQVFEQQAAERNQFLTRWNWLAPAALVHTYFSAISDTDRESHLDFLASIHQFHDELKAIYYDKIFAEETFSQADLEILETKLED